MKYYRTSIVPKVTEEDATISDTLMMHIKEMVQLEHGIEIDGDNYILVLTDEEADALESKDLSSCNTIYLSHKVLLTSAQEKILAQYEVKIIPDYYFENELREAGELW